jgi:hypothetical protein
MARSDDEVVKKLRELYAEPFGGKKGQRFLIAWGDLRSLYGFRKLFESRFARLAELAADSGLYLWDLGEGENGHLVAVIKISTVDRWRRVPKKIIDIHKAPPSDDNGEDAEDDD